MNRIFTKYLENTDKIYFEESSFNNDSIIFREGKFKILCDSKIKVLKCINELILNAPNFVETPDNSTSFYINNFSEYNYSLIKFVGLIRDKNKLQPKETGGSSRASPE